MEIWMKMEHLAAVVVDRLRPKLNHLLIQLRRVLFYLGHRSW